MSLDYIIYIISQRKDFNEYINSKKVYQTRK